MTGTRMKAAVKQSTFLLLLITTFCFAQTQTKKNQSQPDRVDLSGVWVLDESRSNVGSGKDRLSEYSLTIVHHEPEIRMTKRYKRAGRQYNEELIYYTDVRPELKGGRLDSQSTTRWRDGKLVSTSRAVPTGIQTNPPLEIISTGEWELSKNRQTLTRTMVSTGMIVLKSRLVFNRSPRTNQRLATQEGFSCAIPQTHLPLGSRQNSI